MGRCPPFIVARCCAAGLYYCCCCCCLLLRKVESVRQRRDPTRKAWYGHDYVRFVSGKPSAIRVDQCDHLSPAEQNLSRRPRKKGMEVIVSQVEARIIELDLPLLSFLSHSVCFVFFFAAGSTFLLSSIPYLEERAVLMRNLRPRRCHGRRFDSIRFRFFFCSTVSLLLLCIAGTTVSRRNSHPRPRIEPERRATPAAPHSRSNSSSNRSRSRSRRTELHRSVL